MMGITNEVNMDIKISDHSAPAGISVLVSSDDGYNIRFYFDLDKKEVTEFFLQGGEDFPPTVDFAESFYMIIDGVPKSISSIISEINSRSDEIETWLSEESEEAEDYASTTSFYYSRGKI